MGGGQHDGLLRASGEAGALALFVPASPQRTALGQSDALLEDMQFRARSGKPLFKCSVVD